jgi:hypothetical protein
LRNGGERQRCAEAAAHASREYKHQHRQRKFRDHRQQRKDANVQPSETGGDQHIVEPRGSNPGLSCRLRKPSGVGQGVGCKNAEAGPQVPPEIGAGDAAEASAVKQLPQCGTCKNRDGSENRQSVNQPWTPHVYFFGPCSGPLLPLLTEPSGLCATW